MAAWLVLLLSVLTTGGMDNRSAVLILPAAGLVAAVATYRRLIRGRQ